MNRHELSRRFPKASASFIKANLDPEGAGPAAVLEPDPGHAPLETKEVQGSTGAGFLVRITSIRKRLLDEDNLCAKYHCDLLRYAGVIPDDAPGICKIQTTQRKAGKEETEHTIIEVLKI